MKKSLAVLLTASIGVLIFALSGCANGGTFTEQTYLSGENPLKNIIIQAIDRDIEITASEDTQVHIDYYDSEKEYFDIAIADHTLTVKLAVNKEWTDFIGTKPAAEYRKISVKIPDKLLSSLTVSTTNENIKVSSLSFADNVTLDTNGGNIICDRVGVGKAINLTAKNGNITGTVLGGWDDFSISCKIEKGECNLPTNKEDGEKSLVAECNNGNIDIAFVK